MTHESRPEDELVYAKERIKALEAQVADLEEQLFEESERTDKAVGELQFVLWLRNQELRNA